MDNLKAALEAAAKSLMDHSLDHGDESFLHAASTALNEAAKVLEPTPIVYGRFPNPPSWEKGQWVGTDETFDGKPPKTEFFWPSMPQLPSMILVSSLSKQDVNYIPLDTAMAREHLLLEYADAVKKVAMEMVDAGSDVPHSKAWYVNLADRAAQHEQLWNTQWEEARVANKQLEREITELKRKLQDALGLQRATEGMTSVADLPAYEQAAKQQGINWCIKLLQRIAEEHDDRAARMIGYNVRSRAGNELREAIATVRKEEQGMWADE